MTSTIPPSPTANVPLQSTPPRWTAPRVLGASALLLLGALAWQWLWPGAQAHWAPPQPQTMQMAALLAPLPDLDASSLANRWPQRQNELLMLQERPLFVMGRKPPPPPPAKTNTPPPSDQWNTAKVLGTFASAKLKGVFVEIEGQPQRMLEGQVLYGWQLVDVQPQSIQLRQGAQMRQLQVQKKDLTQPSTSAGPASGGATSPSNPAPFAITIPAPAAPAPTSSTPEPAAQAPAPAPKSHAVFGGSSP